MKQNYRFISKRTLSALIFTFIIAVMVVLSGCSPKAASPTTTTPVPSTTMPLTTIPLSTPTPTTAPTTPAPTLTTTPPTTTPPPATTPVVAATPQTILSITGGTVLVMRAGTSFWARAEVGTTLLPGDYIKCANESHAEVTFFEGSTIELDGNTQVSLSDISLSDTGSTTIHLKQYIGSTVSRVKKLTDSESTFEVETQAAVAAVRGSVMGLTVLADGTTIVTNIEGDIRVTAQGVEVIIPEGMESTVIPGQAPGEPEPVTPTPTPTPPGPAPQPVYTARVSTGVNADRADAVVGDTITYTYFITNTGNLPLSNIRVSDDIAGEPAFLGGDGNENSNLDPNETWTYSASHVVSAEDPSPLVNTATFLADIPFNSTTLNGQDQAQVNILSGLFVDISSPLDGATVTSRTITVSGTVSDTSITTGNITINGETHIIAISEGGFSTSQNVNRGENTITVVVSDGLGQTAQDTITINVDVPILGIRVQLTWDTNGTDVDAHLIRPGGTFGDNVTNSDSYYGNNHDDVHPDWGISDNTTDDPFLDQDDRDGYGPENITLEQPSQRGIYQYKVYYFSDNGTGPTIANVTIWINDIQVAQYSKQLVNHELWDCADIEWFTGAEPYGIVYPAPILTVTAAPLEVYVGEDITYTYEVSNAGGAPLEFSQEIDDITGTAAYQSGDTNENNILDPDEVWVYTSVHTATEGEIGTLFNIASALFMYVATEDTCNAYTWSSVTVNPSGTPTPTPN